MWRRRPTPKLTTADSVNVIDDALRLLGQPPIDENELFVEHSSGPWVAEYYLGPRDSAWFGIDAHASGIDVGAYFAEISIGAKQICFERDETVRYLARVLTARFEITERRSGKSHVLRILYEDGTRSGQQFHYNTRQTGGSFIGGPVIAPSIAD